MLMPRTSPNDALVANAASSLIDARKYSLSDLSQKLNVASHETAGAMNQLALRGQAIYDLDAGIYRWRQVLPMALSEKEMGPPHPELAAASVLIAKNQVNIISREAGPRGGQIVEAKVEGKDCQVLITDDGLVRKAKCICSWHYKFGIRNGPCRHIQSVRDLIVLADKGGDENNWYGKMLEWAGG